VGVFAPAKTPQAIIDRLSREIEIVLKDPETDAKIRSIGAAPMIGGSKQLAELLNQEIARAGKVVKDAGIQPE
jgi:tripartite-type tricarboxylate transporter receptor subunit TctC